MTMCDICEKNPAEAQVLFVDHSAINVCPSCYDAEAPDWKNDMVAIVEIEEGK